MSDFPDGTYPVNVRNAVLDVNVTNSSIDVNITNASINVVVDSGTIDANITNTSINVVVQSGTIDANITNASINVVVDSGTIDANITNASLDVNVLGGTIDANITNATLDVNVKNSVLNVQVSGQASVSIDNASVYLNVMNEKNTGEYRTIDNRSNATILVSNYAGWGVLLRNVRGAWKGFSLKVKELSGSNQTLTVCVAIDPTSPPLITKTFTVPANSDGNVTDWNFWRIWWDYDTAFIYIAQTNSNVQLYVEDAGHGGKGFIHGEGKYTSVQYAIGFMLEIKGSFFSTIPVSGTVNTINIPNRAAGTSGADVNVPGLTEVSLLTVEGMGTVHYVRVMTNLGYMNFNFYVDGELIAYGGLGYTLRVDDLYNFDPNQASEKVKWLLHDTSGMVFVAEWCIPLQFKRSFEIRAYNPDANTNNARVLYCVYDLIS